MRLVAVAAWAGYAACSTPASAQQASGAASGTLIVDGGGATAAIVRRFVELAGGRGARIVAFPTGASSVRFGEPAVILDPDWPRDRKEWGLYQAYLRKWLDVEDVTVLHTRDRGEADLDAFVAPLRSATGVYLAAGNAGRYTSAKRDAELVNVVDAHPEILGIGIDDDAALVVRGGVAEVIGTGRAAVYDNVRHGNAWYYWLDPGDRLVLATRIRMERTRP